MSLLYTLRIFMLLFRLALADQYTPVPFNPGATSSDTPLVTGQTLGTLRSNFTGCAGFIFTAQQAMTVTKLGRWVVSGNTGSHTLTLTDVTGTSLGSCSLNTSGQTAGAYAYCTLGSSVSLSNTIQYLMFSQESSGGDQWYDDNTAITVTSAATVASSEFGTISGANCTAVGGNATGLHSYVPPNLQYH